MTAPNWSLIDSSGPPDDMQTGQTVVMEESESLVPDASLEDVSVQEVKP
jgi:hypothetical protein